MQAEIAKELISTNDATITGILLAFISILLVGIGFLWKEVQKLQEYIRSQDKANLEMLSALARSSETLGSDMNYIKDYTIEIKPKINQVLEIIQKRLDNGRNG
ncbi:hypothetical protein Phi19:2_gp031 [Cellulophaga phage phi19:2]|uniref:Uncharacterized protein n=3 Tax=Cellulophaga phage phiST TaxID=756282 RepID=M4T1U1_9CAUD|nr:hypothetical protein CGPG_00076 [Cellulophaga phage phiST]AGH56774.1 hypothetical protein CGPG_00076 [Cellulophaga phage phiST]AGO47170.1 hypothetical protein PhiST_gp031 [Cellulophaga phage phiST]AGO48666.1 hypothetical protein Phi19:2_gp031 [Cellulophaga phage phi19:2]AGO49036.1 hypothetical protein Phi13:1_gp025 [Cellulophaga phage phi13:1]